MIYGYCRVSTGQQAERESLGVQERMVRGQSIVIDQGEPVLFIERGITGSIPVRDRPEGSKLFADLAKGDIVIIPYFDRMFRDALDALQTLKWCEQNGVILHIMDLGGDVLNSPFSKAIFAIIAALAQLRREEIRERVKGTKRDQKARGRYLGGIVPWGHVVTPDGAIEPIPECESAIQQMNRLRARGLSYRDIAVEMCQVGTRISFEKVRQLLAA